LGRREIEETDISKFPLRNHNEHLKHAKQWLETKNHTAREKLVKEHGARWSVLNELKYWRPIEYCSIELMHALILGNLKDHSLQFFALPAVGAKLKDMQEKDEKWKNDESYKEPPFTGKFGPKPKGFVNIRKTKRKQDMREGEEIVEQPKKRTLVKHLYHVHLVGKPNQI